MDLSDFLLARFAEDRRFLVAASKAGERWREANIAESQGFEGQSGSVVAKAVESDQELAEAMRPFVWVPMPNDAARVVAEIDAKTAFVEFAKRSCELAEQQPDEATRLSMRRRWGSYWTAMTFMVEPFAGHPDYDPAWAPAVTT